MQFTKTEKFPINLNPLILVVENDEDNQLLLKYAIAMFGWRYIFALKAIDAISLTKEKQPDLILLDIVMPDMNGFQIARLIKGDQATRNIPLIAVTGLVRKIEIDLIMATGFDAYIGKPYCLEDLYQVISLTLNNRIYS